MTLTNSSQDLRPTHVVTCFLTRNDGNTPRILLVQRSSAVGTYHEHWAGISGFVEKDISPEDQAYTEIREETRLKGDQVHMLRRGTVIEYSDASVGRHWYVHPFLFEVRTPDSVKTDWEAVSMRWVEPSALSNYQTVPKLQEAYTSAFHGEEV